MDTLDKPDRPLTDNDARTELGRFFAIVGHAFAKDRNAVLPMFSPYVDEEWHRLLRAPEHHDLFCREHSGSPIGHLSTGGTGRIGWIAAYEAAYGPLSRIWFTDVDGTVDEEAWANYKETGTVVTDWDCRPVRPDDDPEGQPAAAQRPAHTTSSRAQLLPDHASHR